MTEVSIPPISATSRPRFLLAILLVVVGFGLGVDQAGKGWAFRDRPADGAIVEIAPGLFAGAQGRNFGAMFSQDGLRGPLANRVGMTLVGLASIVMLLRWAVRDRDRWRPIDALAGGLVIGGALGNLIDRMVLGYVRDFLVLESYPGAIFNPADLFMAAGFLVASGAWAWRRSRSLRLVSLRIGLRPSVGATA